jgi:hypothetical protein
MKQTTFVLLALSVALGLAYAPGLAQAKKMACKAEKGGDKKIKDKKIRKKKLCSSKGGDMHPDELADCQKDGGENGACCCGDPEGGAPAPEAKEEKKKKEESGGSGGGSPPQIPQMPQKKEEKPEEDPVAKERARQERIAACKANANAQRDADVSACKNVKWRYDPAHPVEQVKTGQDECVQEAAFTQQKNTQACESQFP